jgi:hypothetical protein
MLLLYPRRFRDEYGADMVLLFAEQLCDEPAARVWLRTAVDLTITAPTCHLETHMNRPPSSFVPAAIGAVSVAGLLFALIGGSSLAMVGVGLAVAVIAGAVAFVAWRQTRSVAPALPTGEQWWRFLAAGAATLVGLTVVTTITGELDDWSWMLAMVVLLSGLISLAAGFVLGMVHLAGHRGRQVAG